MITGVDETDGGVNQAKLASNKLQVANYVWDSGALAWARATQASAATGPNVTVTNFPASYAVTGPLTDTQLRATAVPVSLTSTTITGTVAATQSGTWSTGRTWSLTSGTDSVTTVPSGTQTVAVSGSVAVTGPLTDTQLRATAVPVSGTFWQATQPVSLATNTPTIQTGSNIIGRVGIDQTTPGTTNKVSIGTDGVVGATQSGAWSTGRTWALASGSDSVTTVPSGTQTVSGTITANQGGAPWTMRPDGTLWSLTGTSANVNVTNASIPVTQSGTWNIGSITTLPSIPAGNNNVGDVDVASIVGTGSIANAQVTVTTTSAQVVAARTGRRSLVIVNHGTTDVYLGTGTVTTANGLYLKGTSGASVSIPTSAAVNGIVGSGTQVISYMEVF